jgi:hypothetical protein
MIQPPAGQARLSERGRRYAGQPANLSFISIHARIAFSARGCNGDSRAQGDADEMQSEEKKEKRGQG